MTSDQSIVGTARNPDRPPATGSSPAEPVFQLNRWLVHFASGTEWSSVGEFVAADAAAAVERARAVFGDATDYRAEQIPWDAAPLSPTKV